MPPIPPSINTLILQALIQFGPVVAQALVEIFQKGEKEITKADWDKIFALAEKSYDDYVRPQQ